MRFIFKTSYEQDIRLAKHGGHVFWYSLLCLALVAAPWVAPEYWLAQLTFVLIYAIVGLGLMLLAGFSGVCSCRTTESFYFLCLVIAGVSPLAILNLLRSPTGRAFVAIRDSEISAQSMGIHLARYKTLSFSISAALAGIGGALYAHKLQFI